jgi:5-methylcytosine-specific restriction endonuclease McrA
MAPDTELCPERVRSRSADARATAGSLEPIAPGRYKVQFTASASLHDKLVRLQTLLSSQGQASLPAVIEAAVDEKLRRLEAQRLALTASPRKSLKTTDVRPVSRKVPHAVRRTVWRRDEGQCRFVAADGRRCTERRGLEFHHRQPYGMGGDHAVDNVLLLCKPHHACITEKDWGSYRPGAADWNGAP